MLMAKQFLKNLLSEYEGIQDIQGQLGVNMALLSSKTHIPELFTSQDSMHFDNHNKI